jgi:predicted MFS family arabinose efflux permease
VIGGIVIGRFVSQARRVRALRPLALLSMLALVPLAADLPLTAVLGLYAASGFGMSFLLPLNAMFVQVLPISFRARAFGVVASGLQVSQGLAMVIAGWAAGHVATVSVIAACGVVGALVLTGLTLAWPSEREAALIVPEPA